MIMEKCILCPRKCGADRKNGKKGYCGESNKIRVARTSLHQWEEPCITGKNGSGTIFFSGCALKCIFCQNYNIADSSIGKEFTEEELADAMIRLQEHKASNINLVTAGHFAEQLVQVIKRAREKGLHIPIVYNSSGYETVETLRKLDGLIDVYLPACKFFDPKVSAKYAKAPDYFQVTKEAIEEMVRQAEFLCFDKETGNMLKGVIVRHLILPGHTKDSMEIIRYLHETYDNKIYLSIMNQYTPMGRGEEYPNLNRGVTKREYKKVIDYCLSLGVENAFIQEGKTAGQSFIPAFDCSFL